MRAFVLPTGGALRLVWGRFFKGVQLQTRPRRGVTTPSSHKVNRTKANPQAEIQSEPVYLTIFSVHVVKQRPGVQWLAGHFLTQLIGAVALALLVDVSA